jgi:MoaA/NifB/PqqE/SkfB family radical SAM enzyme
MYEKESKVIRAYCSLPFTRAKIGPEGNVCFCCHQSPEGVLGNLFEESFEDLWFSDKAEDVRKSVTSAAIHPVCNTLECPFQYTDIEAETQPMNVRATGYPDHLEFDLHGSHCNFGGLRPTPDTACIFCPRAKPNYHEHLDKYPDRTDEIIDKIKHITRYLRIINISGISEPFWKDKIFDVLERLGHTKDIQIITTTNASVFDRNRQRRFLEMVDHSEICFSVDAATAKTYKRLRQHNFFDRVCSYIKSWCEMRGDPEKHQVNLHNNINMWNVHEVEDMVLLCKELGVERLILLPTHDCAGTHHNIKNILVNQDNHKIFAEAQQKATKLAEKEGLWLTVARPLNLCYVAAAES